VQLPHSFLRAELGSREFTGELGYDFVRTLPMEQISRHGQALELADTDLHRVAISVDVARLGRVVKFVPESSVMVHGNGGEGHCATGDESHHYTCGELFHPTALQGGAPQIIAGHDAEI